MTEAIMQNRRGPRLATRADKYCIMLNYMRELPRTYRVGLRVIYATLSSSSSPPPPPPQWKDPAAREPHVLAMLSHVAVNRRVAANQYNLDTHGDSVNVYIFSPPRDPSDVAPPLLVCWPRPFEAGLMESTDRRRLSNLSGSRLRAPAMRTTTSTA